MRVVHLNEGPKAAFQLEGTVLSVHGVAIDLAARQRDVQTVIDLSLAGDLKTVVEGVGAWYVATVVIPARSYHLVDCIGEDGQPAQRLEPLPLDVNEVELRLWALPEVNGANKTGEEG